MYFHGLDEFSFFCLFLAQSEEEACAGLDTFSLVFSQLLGRAVQQKQTKEDLVLMMKGLVAAICLPRKYLIGNLDVFCT